MCIRCVPITNLVWGTCVIKSCQSKWLQIYWHQSEGIRPPFNRVDSVLLELPYDGLTDWLPCHTTSPHFDIILTIFYSAIASPGQTISHLRGPNYLAIQEHKLKLASVLFSAVSTNQCWTLLRRRYHSTQQTAYLLGLTFQQFYFWLWHASTLSERCKYIYIDNVTPWRRQSRVRTGIYSFLW